MDDVLKLAREIFGDIVVSVEGTATFCEGSERWPGDWISIDDDNRPAGDEEGTVITFTNGKRVRFKCSEWGQISAA